MKITQYDITTEVTDDNPVLEDYLESADISYTDHSRLENLDYEHSGHTGFVPTRMSILPPIADPDQTTNIQRMKLYVEDNGTASNISLYQIKQLNTKIIDINSTQNIDNVLLTNGDFVYINGGKHEN